MKSALATGGLGGIITVIAAAGPRALAGLAVVLVVILGFVCWIIANRDRTANTVAIITATRSNPPTPDGLDGPDSVPVTPHHR